MKTEKMTNAEFVRGLAWALRIMRGAEVQPGRVKRLQAELRRRYRQRRPLVGPRYKFRVRSIEATARGMVVTFQEKRQ